MTLPGQIMIDIDLDPHIKSILAGFTALAAKLLFSTSLGFQKITTESVREVNILIGKMLVTFDYTQPVAAEPLNAANGRRQNDALWERLAAQETNGDG